MNYPLISEIIGSIKMVEDYFNEAMLHMEPVFGGVRVTFQRNNMNTSQKGGLSSVR